MRHLVLRLIAAGCFVLLLSVALDAPSGKANPQNVYGYTCVSYIPADWGEFRGGNQQTGLAFQDRTGTIRFVTNLPCDATPQPALEIRRSSPASNN